MAVDLRTQCTQSPATHAFDAVLRTSYLIATLGNQCLNGVEMASNGQADDLAPDSAFVCTFFVDTAKRIGQHTARLQSAPAKTGSVRDPWDSLSVKKTHKSRCLFLSTLPRTLALWCYRLRSREVYNLDVFQTMQHRPSVMKTGFHCRIVK